jgi:hypothetical protein
VIKIKGFVTGVREVNVRLIGMPDRIRAEILDTMRQLTGELETHVTGDYLSGQALNVVTGRLRGSIGHRVYQEGNAIIGEVYSAGVPYARIQNDGGRTGPHIIEPHTAKMLHFFGSRDGAELFLRRVNHPGSRFKGKFFMGKALFDMRGQIVMELFEAAIRGAHKK